MKKILLLTLVSLLLSGCANNNVRLNGGKGNVGGTISTTIPF